MVEGNLEQDELDDDHENRLREQCLVEMSTRVVEDSRGSVSIRQWIWENTARLEVEATRPKPGLGAKHKHT